MTSVALAFAGDVVTVPWNGHSGAVSFTFDDALESQLIHVAPALKQRNIHATFFLYDAGNAFTNNKDRWVAVAKDGNELANHSVNHADFSKTTDAIYEVSDMANRLREADASIEANTFAYPYCAIGNESAIESENIIGRGCWFMPPFNPMQWNAPPSNWNNVGAIYVGDDASASGPTMDAINAAKNGGWIVTLHHGVGGDWVAITKENLEALLDKAIQNNLWIGTYAEVAAYWRAGLTMDTVHSSQNGNEWNLTWKSPHAKMPRSVPLRIRPDVTKYGQDFAVFQNGKSITANTDGSYTIEFMTLSATILKAGSSSSSQQSSSSSVQQTAYSSHVVPGTIQVENYDLGGEGIAYHDDDGGNFGNNYRQDGVDLDIDGSNNFALGWTVAGEWLEYTINIQKESAYQVTARVASGLDSSAFHLELDGASIGSSMVILNTGGWTTFTEILGEIHDLPSGKHVLRLVIDRSYGNVDWIHIQEVSPTKIHKRNAANHSIPHIYKLLDEKGVVRYQGSSLPANRTSGIWVLVEEDMQGRALRSNLRWIPE